MKIGYPFCYMGDLYRVIDMKIGFGVIIAK